MTLSWHTTWFALSTEPRPGDSGPARAFTAKPLLIAKAGGFQHTTYENTACGVIIGDCFSPPVQDAGRGPLLRVDVRPRKARSHKVTVQAMSRLKAVCGLKLDKSMFQASAHLSPRLRSRTVPVSGELTVDCSRPPVDSVISGTCALDVMWVGEIKITRV